MTFELVMEVLSALATAFAVGASFYAASQHRRARRAEQDLDATLDSLWEAEDRAGRAEAAGARALDGAEAGARAKSRFLATVTHEMRTPLSGVIGTAQLLGDTRLAPDQRTYVSAILGSAEAMLALVDEILDLSSIEAERPSLVEAPLKVSDLVEAVAELLAPRAQAKRLDLAALMGRDAPDEIVADVARIRQILLNLAGNAIKFTTAGGVGLRVDRHGDGVRFSVHDTGPGFEPAEAERLFAEFERAASAATVPGVGLGLAISRRLAEAMGGELTAEAVPGDGAVFSLTLPNVAATGKSGGGRALVDTSVVVASASPFSGPWLVERLANEGAEATLVGAGAGAGAEALKSRVEAARASVAIVDRGLGGKPSELAAAARAGGAERVILLLSPAERGELASLGQDGFDGYLVKPVRAGSLASRILDPRGGEDVGVWTDAVGAVTYPAARGGLKVLVAEDDPVSALIALAHLARLGHASVHVADGLSACEAFEREIFDAALIDVRMPRLDGLSAARRMRAFESASERRPARMLALTANAGAEDRAAALEAGLDAVLSKPLDRRALAGELERHGRAETRVA